MFFGLFKRKEKAKIEEPAAILKEGVIPESAIPEKRTGLKLIPAQHRAELSMAIAKGKIKELKTIIEQNDIDVDAFVDDVYYTPLIMKAVTSFGIAEEEDRLIMIRYLLEKGANPNVKCKSGYNSLHVTLQQEKLVKVSALLLEFNGDVNLPDHNGCTVAYWALQGFPWRTEAEVRQLHLNVVEQIMMLGADLDYPNRHGVTPRKWLEHTPEDVKLLVARCALLKPVYRPDPKLQSEFPSDLQHSDVAKKIWKTMVPPSGQADTVQGELLRAIEKLRDEAHRNGNINYSASHKLLAQFVMNTLINSELFNQKEIAQIKREAKKLMKASAPYLEDDAYDYLTDQICIFYLKNEHPIPHQRNLDILC
ncbi:ankyrin repeat domain-containing protein [Pedobacter caeni]|uniref:Uncharacterized protein n=1 Tax=Pedobacter caeni TaxID=288992 RepID=A0A1M5JK89_9SPHI|nr:ankyrin repeat domain-containing protein [Pedobacter caeni]SHG40977.1 hypothetical protein SAMN04488522_105396 [Pedobacter caeni]